MSCDLTRLPPELLGLVLDGPDWARGHMIRLDQDRAIEQASHGPRGWATWAEQFVPFLIGTEDPSKIRDLVLTVWSWHRVRGLNPWNRTRSNTYSDFERWPGNGDFYDDYYNAYTGPYERKIGRTGSETVFKLTDVAQDREVDYAYHILHRQQSF
jgi:hypothetical protein